MTLLIHYYYGDKNNTFYTALGSATRAKGHRFKVELLVINSEVFFNSNLNILKEFHANYVITYEDLCHHILRWLNGDNTENDNGVMYILINFDEIYLKLEESDKKKLINDIHKLAFKAEIILTGEKEIEDLIAHCDYVSFFTLPNTKVVSL